MFNILFNLWGYNLNTAERLKKIRGDMTQADFAKLIGIHKNSLKRYERGESEPDIGVCSKICSVFGVSPDWLILGTGPMKKDTPQETEDDSDLIMIPMANAVLSAGSGSLETDGDSERSYAFRRDFIARKGSAKNMVLMRVSGDSMEPEIMDGDVVLLDQSKLKVIPGRIFAVGFEDSIYLKRIDMLPGQAILKSINPAYPPVNLDLRGQNGDKLRLIGQVLWVGREYR